MVLIYQEFDEIKQKYDVGVKCSFHDGMMEPIMNENDGFENRFLGLSRMLPKRNILAKPKSIAI